MRVICVALALLAAALPAAHAAAATSSATKELHALFESEWERGLRENPVAASYQGDSRYDDRWADRSVDALARSHAADRAVLEALERIPPGRLSEADRLNRDLFARQYRGEVDAYEWGLRYLPITQRGGVQTAHQLAEVLPFKTVQDYENWIARLGSLDTYVDQTIVLMREGIRRGLVLPRVIMERVPAQIAKQVVAELAESPFYAPFRKMPGSIPLAEQE